MKRKLYLTLIKASTAEIVVLFVKAWPVVDALYITNCWGYVFCRLQSWPWGKANTSVHHKDFEDANSISLNPIHPACSFAFVKSHNSRQKKKKRSSRLSCKLQFQLAEKNANDAAKAACSSVSPLLNKEMQMKIKPFLPSSVFREPCQRVLTLQIESSFALEG